jgi:probable phosphoglycerate mutase
MIYFVRHGECGANVKGVFAGQADDSPLTSKGREQAVAVGKRLKNNGLKLDRIITSPLQRARETAEIIAEVVGLEKDEIEADAGIAEYDMGSLSGTPVRVLASFEEACPPDAENIMDFQSRVMGLVERLEGSSKNILLVSHAGVGRVIEGTWLGMNPKEFYTLPGYANGCLKALGVGGRD